MTAVIYVKQVHHLVGLIENSITKLVSCQSFENDPLHKIYQKYTR